MTKEAKPKKRIGRPTKEPRPGERVGLGLRVTPEMKRQLEGLASFNGRSLSQEVEQRLEQSLFAEQHLVIARRGIWSPVLFMGGDMVIPIGDDPRDYPVPPGDPPHQETLVILKVSEKDRRRMHNYFSGAPWPYDQSLGKIASAEARRRGLKIKGEE